MNFNELINKLMPFVNEASEKPLVLWRNKEHEWNIEQQKPLSEIKNVDHYAISFTGSEYAGASPAFVFDKIFTSRLRAEFETIPSTAENYDSLHALVNFTEDNISNFSTKTLEYIALYDKPLIALQDFIGFSLKSPNTHLSFDETMASEAIEIIETKIAHLINHHKEEINITKPKLIIEGYEEIYSVQLAGETVVMGENPSATEVYLVCNVKTVSSLGLEERFNGQSTNNFVEAMRDFITRVDVLLIPLEKERFENSLPIQVLTTNDCIQHSQETDWKDKLLIIKPEFLAPEYKSAEHQLAICTGGFGANANARGRAVFVKELFSGNEARYERHQIAGVADTLKLPTWATEKLKLEKAPNSKDLPKDIPKKKPTLQEKLENAKGKTRDLEKVKDKVTKNKNRGGIEVGLGLYLKLNMGKFYSLGVSQNPK